MSLIKDIKLVLKIKKSVKQAKAIIDEHEHLTGDLQKAILNIKADFEVLAGLLPSLKGVYKDIKDLLNA